MPHSGFGGRVAVSSLALFLLQSISVPAFAAPLVYAAVPELKDLVELSVEQLSQITVTSVARREQRLSDAPAAVYVITNEEIRRSGVTSLPEALRLAPNLQVARADTNQYAISARGFNNVLANKLLVMIDGRTVYSPLFSGVFWDAQHVMLEDIDRIEVISGPGATLWGANAVNGVINVITKRAEETQGALVAAGAGNLERQGSARWGGRIGETGRFRVYGTFTDRDNSKLTSGAPVQDASENFQAGFRTDWGSADSRFTVQGDAYRNDVDQLPGGSRDLSGANVIARWQRQWNHQTAIRIQAYYDLVERNQPGAINDKLHTWDLDAQYEFPLGRAHQFLVGMGARYMRDDLQNLGPALAFVPASRNLQRRHVFVQDGIGLSDTVDLTLGLKVEYNNYTDWEVLPSIRASWRLAPTQMLWTALSRAVRAPSRVDREFFAPANPPFQLAGGPDFESEVANVVEAGIRGQPASSLSYSFTVFHHDFDRLRTTEPAPGGAVARNGMEGRLNGISGWGSYRVNSAMRLHGGFSRFWEKRSLDSGVTSIGGTAAAGNDPEYWWHLGSSINFTPRHELDVRVRRVGSLPNGPVPTYTAVDARFGWKVSRELELSLTVQNMTDPGHPEWGPPSNRAEIERAAFIKLLWRK